MDCVDTACNHHFLRSLCLFDELDQLTLVWWLQTLIDHCGFPFDTTCLSKEVLSIENVRASFNCVVGVQETRAAVRLAFNRHDKQILQLLKTYADIPDTLAEWD